MNYYIFQASINRNALRKYMSKINILIYNLNFVIIMNKINYKLVHAIEKKRLHTHTSSPNFFRGSSDENEKVFGKFLARLRRAKKGVPNFSPAAAFFRCGGTETR